jgi:hypothetical protein
LQSDPISKLESERVIRRQGNTFPLDQSRVACGFCGALGRNVL